MAGSEFELIERFFGAQAGTRPDVPLGIGDDCALLQLPAGTVLAVTTDTLVADIHFAAGLAAEDVGYKALAVNLSDLAAMGAQPAWVTLALTLPVADDDWLAGFSQGFLSLARVHGVQLVGGDTTRGPLSVTVQAMGNVPAGEALRRSGARPGDLVYVTGTLGDAGVALLVEQRGYKPPLGFAAFLSARLNRPQPRVAAGLLLRSFASAAIDVSDGLAADLGHVLTASGVGATLYLDTLPVSAAMQTYLDTTGDTDLALYAGDDYELCFTVPADRQAVFEQSRGQLDCPCTWIGVIEATAGLRGQRADGEIVALDVGGYDHFGVRA